MRIAVLGEGYSGAVGAFVGGNRLAAETCSTLASRLQGYAGMAGDDASATEFASSYDEAAAEALATLAELVGGFGSLGHLAEASLANHCAAEVASGGRSVAAPPSRAAGSVGVVPAMPPSSLGGDSPSLPGPVSWVLDQIEGFVWPDADTDRLRSAAGTWRTAAESAAVAATYCEEALSALADERSPEIPLAIATTQDLRARVDTLADQLAAVGNACDTYAAQVDAKRAEMVGLLTQLAVELGIGAAVGVGLSLISGGLAGAAAGAAGSARLATAARELKLIVDSLRIVAGGPALELRTSAAATRDVGVFGRKLSSARVMLMEAGESGAGRSLTSGQFGRGFLARHENDYAHTLREHVGKTQEQMRQRLVERSYLRQTSTYRTERQAELAVERVFQQNERAIGAWLRSGNGKRAFVGDPGLADPGDILVRSTGEIIRATKAKIVLIPDESMPAGWRLLTSYPCR